ncbi:MAG: serine protease [Isosphaeraceae bacterium]
MRLGRVAVVLLTLGLQRPAAGAGFTDDQLSRSVARLIAVPREGKVVHIGTGFVYDSEGSRRRLLTSAHLVKDAAGVRVEFPGSPPYHAVRAWVDRVHDLAVIELNADAPKDATPMRAYAGPHPSNRADFTLRVAGYLQGYTVSTLRSAKWENRVRAREVRADGKASEDSLDADTEIYQLHVDFSDGGSGSPVVDPDGRVIGVYQGGPLHGALSLNFCVPYYYFDGVVRRAPVDMTLVGNDIERMGDLLVNGLMLSGTQGVAGELPTQFVVKRVPHDEIFRDFFGGLEGKAREEMLKGVGAILDHGKRRINHAINTRVGVGFLVPEGFELEEVFDKKSGASILTVRRPGSDYAVRYYSRRLALAKKDTPGEKDSFQREARRFLSRGLEVEVELPNTPPGQADKVAVAPRPISWPAAYRDSFADDLITFRTYLDRGQALIHAYGFEMCRRASRFGVSGLSAPAAAFAEKEPSEELLELFFILNSTYDTELGLERSKLLRKEPGRNLPRAFDLETPPPATAPPAGFPAVKLNSPFPPAPDDGVEVGQQPQEGEGGPPPQPPSPPVHAAPNLGITFQMVQFANGRLGARLNQPPAPGSPAARVLLGPNSPGTLNPGDTVVSLDGIPVTGPNSPLMHFGPTWIDFISAAGQPMRAYTVLPGPGPGLGPVPLPPGFPPGPGPAVP